MFGIPDGYTSERFGVSAHCLRACQFYELINEHILSLLFGQWEFLKA